MAGIQLLALVWGILRVFREPCAKPPHHSLVQLWDFLTDPSSQFLLLPLPLPAVLRTVPPRLPSPAPIQVTENLAIHAPVKGRGTGAAASLHPSQPAPCCRLLQWCSGTSVLLSPGVCATQQGGMGTFQIPSFLLGAAASVSGSPVVHVPAAPLTRKGGDITVLPTVVNSLPGILPDESGCFSLCFS